MKRASVWAAGLAAACVAGAPAMAADAKPPKPPPKTVLLEAARAAPTGRAMKVLVAQAELSSNINASYVTVAAGGGLLGVLIDAKVDSDRTKRAANYITPIRDALLDFDADELAVGTTRKAAAALPWLGTGEPAFGRDPSPPALADAVAAGPGQVAFFTYVYDTSADFSSLRVSVTISIADKTAGKAGDPNAPLQPKNLVYRQVLTSVATLDHPGTGEENAARWGAHDGALAKKAITAGFDDLARLIPRAMTLTADDLERMDKAEKKSIGAYGGRLQEEGPDGTLLYNGGLIHVRMLSE